MTNPCSFIACNYIDLSTTFVVLQKFYFLIIFSTVYKKTYLLMEHCSRRDMAPIPAALTIVGRHRGEGSHVLKWFDGMK
jgi:hypothetical protein